MPFEQMYLDKNLVDKLWLAHVQWKSGNYLTGPIDIENTTDELISLALKECREKFRQEEKRNKSFLRRIFSKISALSKQLIESLKMLRTDRHRCTISVSPEIWERVKNFRFEEKFNTMNEAIVFLLFVGLNALEEKETGDE